MEKINFAMSKIIYIFAVANGEKSVCRKKAHLCCIPKCETGHFTTEAMQGIGSRNCPCWIVFVFEYILWSNSEHRYFCIAGKSSPHTWK